MGHNNQVQAIGSSTLTDNSVRFNEFSSATTTRPITDRNNPLNTDKATESYASVKSRHATESTGLLTGFTQGLSNLFNFTNYNPETRFSQEATGHFGYNNPGMVTKEWFA